MRIVKEGKIPDRQPHWLEGEHRCSRCGCVFVVEEADLAVWEPLRINVINDGRPHGMMKCPTCGEFIKVQAPLTARSLVDWNWKKS